MNKEGETLIIDPAPRKSLIELLDSWKPLGPEDDFPEIDDPPPEPVAF